MKFDLHHCRTSGVVDSDVTGLGVGISGTAKAALFEWIQSAAASETKRFVEVK